MSGLRFPSSLEASSLEGMLSSTVGSVLVLVGGTVEGEFSLDNSAMFRTKNDIGSFGTLS